MLFRLGGQPMPRIPILVALTGRRTGRIDPESCLWWSKDTAGHGGSAWKVYEESSRGLIWRADANQYGDFIVGKHKSDVGTFIPWKDLN